MHLHNAKNTIMGLALREHKAYTWMDSLLSGYLTDEGDRTQLIYHLIGTDRAFGVFFPEFFFPKSVSGKDAENLFRLFLASRAYLIAHDAALDEDRTTKIRKALANSMQTFRKECIKILQKLVGKAKTAQIMRFRDSVAEKAYNSDFSKRPPNSSFTFERCSYWYLFFDALSITNGIKIAEKQKRLFDLSLFLLQIADDFDDMEDDLQKENNANLLAWSPKRQKLQIPASEKEKLRKYALVAIWRTAKEIAKTCGPKEPMGLWAEEIFKLLSCNDLNALENCSSQLFGKDWPVSYLPPVLSNGTSSVQKVGIELRQMNGVKISAESINSFASQRAIAKMTKTQKA